MRSLSGLGCVSLVVRQSRSILEEGRRYLSRHRSSLSRTRVSSLCYSGNIRRDRTSPCQSAFIFSSSVNESFPTLSKRRSGHSCALLDVRQCLTFQRIWSINGARRYVKMARNSFTCAKKFKSNRM